MRVTALPAHTHPSALPLGARPTLRRRSVSGLPTLRQRSEVTGAGHSPIRASTTPLPSPVPAEDGAHQAGS